MTVVLETRGLIKRFGGLTATDNVSLTLEQGARHALIGPNGAGKTTLINLLTGVIEPSSGTILLEGRDITRMRPEARVKLGLVRTFQINQLFPALTPLDSLLIACAQQAGHGGRWWQPLRSDKRLVGQATALAERFHIREALFTRTSQLPYGKQRQLEIAIAFACSPRVLLLDEPAAGVADAERVELLATIASLPREVSVLLIEHDMDLVFRFADRITVLVNGAKFTDGTPQEMASDARVRAVYLGEDGGHA